MSAPLLRRQVQLSYNRIVSSPAPVIQTAPRAPPRRLTLAVALQPLLQVLAAHRHSLARLSDDHGQDNLANPMPGEFEPDGDLRSSAAFERFHADMHICPDRPVDAPDGPRPGRADLGNLRRRRPLRAADLPRDHAPGPDLRRPVPLHVPLDIPALPLPEPRRIRDIGKYLVNPPPDLNPRHDLRHAASFLGRPAYSRPGRVGVAE